MLESTDTTERQRADPMSTAVPVSRLLEAVGARVPAPLAHVAVTGIAYRSDAVSAGDAFFAVRGFTHDGHAFAKDAAERGASVLVVEEIVDGVSAPQIVVADTRVALALAAAAFWGAPSASLDVIGITGTNGKTTTTYLLESILKAAGRKPGLIGTVGTRIAGVALPAGRTTPESADLQALLARMRDSGVDSVAMEVSSHAIDLHRVDGVAFSVGAFTNLTQDHLDYHHTFEEYASVKRRFFEHYEVGTRVVNVDDPVGAAIAEELGVEITVGRCTTARVRGLDELPSARGSRFRLTWGDSEVAVDLPLAGAFNVSNALVAAGCALALGIDLDTVARGLEAAPQVPGRFERIDAGQPFTVVVDYAHTPDGLEKAAAAARAVTRGRLIVVFGCGGDRDPEKRSLMGRAAASAADHVVITTDNPRSEDPVGIILQIEDGLRGTGVSWQSVVDRRRAIAEAVSQATEGDTVLIAGKGHEDYQIFADRTVHFDDREVAREEVLRLC